MSGKPAVRSFVSMANEYFLRRSFIERTWWQFDDACLLLLDWPDLIDEYHESRLYEEVRVPRKSPARGDIEDGIARGIIQVRTDSGSRLLERSSFISWARTRYPIVHVLLTKGADFDSKTCRDEATGETYTEEGVEFTVFRDLIRLWPGIAELRESEKVLLEDGKGRAAQNIVPLHPTVQAIMHYIEKNPGKFGKEIAKAVDTSEQNFRRLFSEHLSSRGYYNVRGQGYFPPKGM